MKCCPLGYFIYIDFFVFYFLFDDVASTSDYEPTVSNGHVFGEECVN